MSTDAPFCCSRQVLTSMLDGFMSNYFRSGKNQHAQQKSHGKKRDTLRILDSPMEGFEPAEQG